MHWRTWPRWWKTGVRLLIATGLALPLTANAVNPLECRNWFDRANRALDKAGIRDAGARRIEFYPHLRANRWLASIRPPDGDRRAGQRWVELLAREARRGWRSELLRLAPDARLSPAGRQARVGHMERCIRALVETSVHAGVPELEMPDSYSSVKRALGLYPLTRWMAQPSIQGYRADMRERMRAPAPEPARVFTPPTMKGRTPHPGALPENALELPLPSVGARAALLTHYAPVIAVAQTDRANIPGSVGLANGSPEVVTTSTTAYYWISWTRFQDERLLQLNYQFWFARRPEQGALDPYAGRLDGLIWRVTLKPNGNVLTYDSIHPCGCYHKVYPADPDIRPRRPDQVGQPVYYPERVPNARGQRVRVTLEPDTHYVVDVAEFRPGAVPERGYYLRSANLLRRLPDGNGYGSLFNSNGLVPSTQRGERFYLWPLGVPSAGAMRQPGHHAIAFVGKRHFDDPNVLEQVLEPRPYAR